MRALLPVPRVAAIAHWDDFAAVLAERILGLCGGDPLALARALVLLPNRRAAAALTRAFLRLRDGLLLPRMIGIVDLEDADAPLGDGFTESALPGVPAAERRMFLAGALMRRGVRAEAALTDANSLGAALDTLILERKTPADLRAIDMGGLSGFWQQTLDELRVISEAWPAQLAAEGRVDEAEARVLRLEETARAWSETGADGRLIVAAGISAAPPPVVELLRVVARLPNGFVVLPGLDAAMPQAAWDALDPLDPTTAAHPQTSLKAILDGMGVARAEVEAWGGAEAPARARLEAAARALDPAAFTGQREAGAGAALSDVRLIEASNPAEEALVIAAALRRALEQPGRTAALVTPDRDLAARVLAELERWSIAADDSAGRPLSATPAGTFLRLLATAAGERFAPVPLLALLKHPFAGGEDRLAHLEAVRALDLRLRGPAPPPGLAPIGGLAERDWWAGVEAELRPLDSGGARPLPDWIEALIAAADALAGDRAWRGQDGRALAEVLESLRDQGAPLPEIAADELGGVLTALLEEVAVRPVHGLHPRISILGLLEARLQRADLMVLGGLNEGAWPAPPSPDPWLPPAARRALDLPPLERRTGLAAQDLLNALGGRAVILTRARRDATAPTCASRFLLRLQAMAGPGGLGSDPELIAVARGLDEAAGPPRLAPRPAPVPPLAARPKRISVTAVDLLRSDPFSFYASWILRLGELEPVAGELSPMERGNVLHAALEHWAKSGAGPEALVAQADALFARRFAGQARLMALWRPRLLNALGWAAERLAGLGAEGWRLLAAEAAGELEIHGITLRGRADRVEMGPEGRLAILDYKSGSMPGTGQIAAGYAMQLPLLALMAEHGVLEGAAAGEAGRLEYWRLSGGRSKPGECRDVLKLKDNPYPTGKAAAAAAAGVLKDVADRWLLGNAPFPAKLKPEYAGVSQSYDQLARLQEWVDRLPPEDAASAGAGM